MSRIRTIKPDAFTSESLSQCSPLARWTFAGLWTYMDDSGKCRADSRLLKASLYPLDDSTSLQDIDNAVGELIEAGSIHTYVSGGRQYLHSPQFNIHQKINRPSPSSLPMCPCEDRSHTAHGTLSESSVSLPGGKGKGRGREGEVEGEAATSSPTPTPPPSTSPAKGRRGRPPRKCPDHLHVDFPPPCGKCAEARRAYDEWQPETFTTKTTMCADHQTHPAYKCPECSKAAVVPPKDWRGGKKDAK